MAGTSKKSGVQAYDKQIVEGSFLVPQMVFALAVIGGIGVGKTSLFLNLMRNPACYFRKMNRVVLCSPSVDLDEKVEELLNEEIVLENKALEKLKNQEREESSLEDDFVPIINPPYKKIMPEDIHTEYSPQMLVELIAWQKQHIKWYGKKNADDVLLVFDDAIALGCFRQGHADLLTKLVTKCRHVKISIIFLSQYFKSCPTIIRTCLTAIMFFQCNKTEKENIFSVFDINLPFHVWAENVDIICANTRYSARPFCQINKLNAAGTKLIQDINEFVN